MLQQLVLDCAILILFCACISVIGTVGGASTSFALAWACLHTAEPDYTF